MTLFVLIAVRTARYDICIYRSCTSYLLHFSVRFSKVRCNEWNEYTLDPSTVTDLSLTSSAGPASDRSPSSLHVDQMTYIWSLFLTNISAAQHSSWPTLMFVEWETNLVLVPAGLAMIPFFVVWKTCLRKTVIVSLLYIDNRKSFEVCRIRSDPMDSIMLIESMCFKILSICTVGFQRTVSATTSQ